MTDPTPDPSLSGTPKPTLRQIFTYSLFLSVCLSVLSLPAWLLLNLVLSGSIALNSILEPHLDTALKLAAASALSILIYLVLKHANRYKI